jgi:hypothetical protein
MQLTKQALAGAVFAAGALASLAGGKPAAATTPVSFAAPISIQYPGIYRPYVVDLDGDNHQDIIAWTPSNFIVLYGNGNATFTAVNFPAFSGLNQVTAGDVNGDGKKDIVGTTGTTPKVFLPTAARTFASATSYDAGGSGAGSVTLGDFNGDNKKDIALIIGDNNAMSVLLSNSSGGFSAPYTYGIGSEGWSLVTGDLSGDGKLDIVTTKGHATESGYFIGNGLGGFPTGGAVPISGGAIIGVDMNNDGHLDLACSEYWADGIKIALNDGAGTFTTTYRYGTHQYPASIAAGDFNSDGYKDIVQGHGGKDFFTLQTNKGNGDINDYQIFHSSGNDARVADVGDFNEDGQPDVVLDGWADHLSLFLNITIAPIPAITSIDPASIAAGSAQFNVVVHGNGLVPSSVVRWNGAPLVTSYGDGVLTATIPASLVATAGTASIAVTSPAPGGGTSNVVTFTIIGTAASIKGADFNNDGRSDLMLQDTGTNKAVLWYMNNTALLSAANVTVTPTAGYKAVGAGDFNGDGKPDLVFQHDTTNKVWIWYMNGAVVGSSAFTATTPGVGWRVVSVGDFNADGKPDLVLQNSSSRKIAFWYMNNTALLSGAYASVIPAAGWSVAASGDFNGDNKRDLVLQNSSTNKAAIWFMNGVTLASGAYTSTTPGSGWRVAGVGDFNADGKYDLALQNSSTNKIALWYMNGATLLGGAYTATTPASTLKVTGPR